ncbi:MAG: flagellar biosynthesis protein FliR [Synergistaceae bacterium]|jgi:TRAP-type mannitol/chloroaromatic compound transport system permease small subunit|nr:flagellar biosynthesis protein FliR [Synergistaceae bacterium]
MIMGIPAINIQALAALVFFAAALLVARSVMNIYRGKWPAPDWMLFYLRVLLGFLLAGAIALSYYSFAGVDVISGRLP